jgi:acyl-CoA thioester hydrolase
VTARVTRVRLRLAAGGEAFSAYARVLEEAATLASAEAGYPTSWYARENTAWVIRRSTIDCIAPLARAIDLEVVTWVADFRRVRSRREYEVYVPPRTVIALTAHTDWVYVDRANGRPRRIPDAMISAFVPDGAPPVLPRSPLELPAAQDVATVEQMVTTEDVDALGHVNNARYFDYVEAAGKRIVASGLRAVRHDLEYLAEAREGDRLLCRCWRIGSPDSRVEVAGEIRRAAGGDLLTRARSVWS